MPRNFKSAESCRGFDFDCGNSKALLVCDVFASQWKDVDARVEIRATSQRDTHRSSFITV